MMDRRDIVRISDEKSLYAHIGDETAPSSERSHNAITRSVLEAFIHDIREAHRYVNNRRSATNHH